MTDEERADLEVLLDWLYCSDDSGWTCPACGYANGGAYRLSCKYCCEDGDDHPLRPILERLWVSVGRTLDTEYDELAPPPEWERTKSGTPGVKVPVRWPEYDPRRKRAGSSPSKGRKP